MQLCSTWLNKISHSFVWRDFVGDFEYNVPLHDQQIDGALFMPCANYRGRDSRIQGIFRYRPFHSKVMEVLMGLNLWDDMAILSCFVAFTITSSCLGHSCGIEAIAIARSRVVSDCHIEIMGH